jgi:hypothetical protein
MIKFDFRDYPKFYSTFKEDVRKQPMHQLSSESCKQFVKEKYNLTIEIVYGTMLWEASMDEKEFTMFLLRWT